jgi:hypothetical protein
MLCRGNCVVEASLLWHVQLSFIIPAATNYAKDMITDAGSLVAYVTGVRQVRLCVSFTRAADLCSSLWCQLRLRLRLRPPVR